MESNQPPAGTPFVDPMKPVIEVLQGANIDSVVEKYGIDRSELEKRLRSYQETLRQRALSQDLILSKAGRNDPCPCGSGKKYKKCCLSQHEEARKNLPPDRLQEMEEKERRREKLEKDVHRGFELLFDREPDKARAFAEKIIEAHPEDDRLHDIVVTADLSTGRYDDAYFLCRRRWQVAVEEKEHYQENGFHKREGEGRAVHFFSPSTWLEKLWIAGRARFYSEKYPVSGDARLAGLVKKLEIANDTHKFPGRDEEGFAMRKEALAPVLDELRAAGFDAVPYLLPITYAFSWSSLFVPDLLGDCGNDDCVRLLAELSMFRFPYFAQLCLSRLEAIGPRAVPVIEALMAEDASFDEIKVGLVMVLGGIRDPDSFNLLVRLVDHENPYVVNWVAQSLGRLGDPEAVPHLERARDRVGNLSKIGGAIRELMAQGDI